MNDDTDRAEPGPSEHDNPDSAGAPVERLGGAAQSRRRGLGTVYLVPDSGTGTPTDTGTDTDAERPPGDEWPWVTEWRAGAEPTPWATGLVLAAFSALVVAVAVWVLSAGLADRPIVAVLVNVLVAGGLAPAMWLSRDLPVLRWIAAGALVGILAGWGAAILMLPAGVT